MRLVSVLAVLLAVPAVADEPSFDCARAASAAEELVCADPELAEADRRLAAVYERSSEAVAALDEGAMAIGAGLKATQRGWVTGRDECWKADDLRACVLRAYLAREADLVATWMLEEPVAEAAWTCGGNPANEVFVTYFDTPLPGIRVEYGDSVRTMQLSPAASGSRYDGEFGRYFWEHQGEAMFVWEEGTEQTCTLVAG